jgi:uncharacterized membrane protein YfcA
MDDRSQRRALSIIGLGVAFIGFCAFLWGLLEKDGIMEMIGFFCIIIAYVLTVIVKKIREKEQAIEKQKNT